MRKHATALAVIVACLGAGAHAQADVYTVWVTKNGTGPQPFFFGYGRTVELAEKLAFDSCGDDCTILESGPGCISITVSNRELYPHGCVAASQPETMAEEPE